MKKTEESAKGRGGTWLIILSLSHERSCETFQNIIRRTQLISFIISQTFLSFFDEREKERRLLLLYQLRLFLLNFSYKKSLMGSDERTIFKDKMINDKSNLGLICASVILSRGAGDFYINLFLCFVIYLLWRILKDNLGIYTITAPGNIEKNISPTQLFATCCWNESFCQNHHLSVEAQLSTQE